MAGIALTLT